MDISMDCNPFAGYGKIAFYLRLSLADGDLGRDGKDESNSIENQRLLMHEYVGRIIKNSMGEDDDEFLDDLIQSHIASIPEYIDDGYSGRNFDRPAFKRMIEDAKRKKINTIIVKDTSRLGRDYIEVGDYMEQIFPLLNIRFIAINSNYDSNNYRNTTIGLETSIMNLVNTEYSRDLSRKVKSSRRTLWNQGVPTCSTPLFGYIIINKRYAIDSETAPIVRLIFDKALNGWTTGRITAHLNEMGIPTPGQFQMKRTGRNPSTRIVNDDEWLWDTRKVYMILKNYAYTGYMVQNKFTSLTIGENRRRKNDEKDYVIIENTHEAIVSVEEWKAAQCVIRPSMRKRIVLSTNQTLLGKVRCGNCGLAMEFRSDSIYCGHKRSVGTASNCCQANHDLKRVEGIVASELHRQIGLLEFLGLKIREKSENDEFEDVSAIRRQTETSIKVLKAEKVRQYEAYAEGVISREIYIRKRDEIAEKIEQLEDKLKRTEALQAEEKGILSEIQLVTDTYGALSKKQPAEQSLTRGMVAAMIDSVIIYDEETIEVKFLFDDIGKRAVDCLGTIEV